MLTSAGKKIHRIIFQSATETIADTGEPVVTWVNYRTDEPAEFVPTGGTETIRGRQIEAGTRAIFRVNYRDGYTTQMRILHDSVYYGITYINKVDGLNRELEIMVRSSQ